jgi:hypothetical protein
VIFIVISRNRAYLTLMRAFRRIKPLPFAVVLVFVPLLGRGRVGMAGTAVPQREILIVTPDQRDGRLAATREAIGFWNDTLAELGLTVRLHEAQVLTPPAGVKPFENYTRQIWFLAGKPAPPERRPPPPDALTSLGGDIVVFLSSQMIFSFAWPYEEPMRFFIGVQTDRSEPLTFPNVARNVIAHELGHTLGLTHNGNTPTLMCGPCQHTVYRSNELRFFPVTAEERERLRTLYPAQ